MVDGYVRFGYVRSVDMFGFGYVQFWICSVLDMSGFGCVRFWICLVLDMFGRWICSVGGYVRSWICSVWICLVLDTFKESGFLNDTVVEMKLQKRNLKHRSPEDDEHSVLRLKECDKKTIKKPRRNLRKYDLTLYERGLNECNQCNYKTPRKGDLKIHIQSK